MRTFSILLMGAALSALPACERAHSPAELDREVQREQTDGAREVAEAQRNALADSSQRELPGSSPGAASEALLGPTAGDEYRVAIKRAEAQRKVAETRCTALTDSARDRCKDTAQREYEAARAEAEKRRDTAQATHS